MRGKQQQERHRKVPDGGVLLAYLFAAGFLMARAESKHRHKDFQSPALPVGLSSGKLFMLSLQT
jgi:hypothetical protein